MAARRGSVLPLVVAGLLGILLIAVVRMLVSGGGGEDAGTEQASTDSVRPRRPSPRRASR